MQYPPPPSLHFKNEFGKNLTHPLTTSTHTLAHTATKVIRRLASLTPEQFAQLDKATQQQIVLMRQQLGLSSAPPARPPTTRKMDEFSQLDD